MPNNIKDQYQYYSKANMDKLRQAGYKSDVMKLEASIDDYVKNYLMTGKFLSA